MATVSKNPVPGLLMQGINAGLGFCWGGLMLVLMGLWLWPLSENIGGWFVGVMLALGAAGFLFGAWQTYWHWSKLPAQETAPILGQKRAVLQVAALGFGLICLCLAVFVFSTQGSKAIGEIAGLAVLAIIAVVGGLSLRPGEASAESRDHFFLAMKENRQAVRVVLFGLALLAAGAVTGLILRFGWEARPEIVMCGLLFLVFLGSGLFVALATDSEMTVANLRILVMVVGGLVGFFFYIDICWRLLLWWGPLFGTGGILTALQSEDHSWKIWLCFYGQLFALALMFGSVLVGRPLVRTNVTVRRLLYGYNAAVQGNILLEFLIVLNFAAPVVYPGSLQWTKGRGFHSLSPQSIGVLKELKEPVTVYVLMSQGGAFHFDTQVLLDNCQVYAPGKFKVESVTPEKEPTRYRDLARKYPELLKSSRVMLDRDEDQGRGLLIVYGEETGDKKLPHAFVAQNELGDMGGDMGDPEGGGKELVFKGEEVIMTRLDLLTKNEKKPKLYFTQSNEELDVNDSTTSIDLGTQKLRNIHGCGKLVERLKADNYDVRSLVWGAPRKGQGPLGDLVSFSKKGPEDKHEVPADADVVIIADPQEPFAPDVLDALERYVNKKGRMVVLTNVPSVRAGSVIQTGLEGFLKKYNVVMEQDFIMHFKDRPGFEAFGDVLDVVAMTPEKTSNKLAQGFREPFALFVPRSVKPGLETGNYRVEPILEVRQKENGDFWAEKNLKVLGDPSRYVLELVRSGKIGEKASTQPIPVAAAVIDRDNKPRMVVLGDARFANNGFIRRDQPHYDFLTSSIEWLVESPGKIGIGPKKSGSFILHENNVNKSRLEWLPMGLIVLCVSALGVGLWIVRRR